MNRYEIREFGGAVAIKDNGRRMTDVGDFDPLNATITLYGVGSGTDWNESQQHRVFYTKDDAQAVVDWLNERERGYLKPAATSSGEAKTAELEMARQELTRLLRMLEGHYYKLVGLELANFGSPPPGGDVQAQTFAEFLTAAAQFLQLNPELRRSCPLKFMFY